MAKKAHGQDSPLSVVQEMYEAVTTRDWDTGFGLLTEDLDGTSRPRRSTPAPIAASMRSASGSRTSLRSSMSSQSSRSSSTSAGS
jgi:hypothetical protein